MVTGIHFTGPNGSLKSMKIVKKIILTWQLIIIALNVFSFVEIDTLICKSEKYKVIHYYNWSMSNYSYRDSIISGNIDPFKSNYNKSSILLVNRITC